MGSETLRSPSEEGLRLLRHLFPYGFDLFKSGSDLPQKRQILRHRKVFVFVDELLSTEQENRRSKATTSIGNVPEVIYHAVRGLPVEMSTAPRTEQGRLQPVEVCGVAQAFETGDLLRNGCPNGFDAYAVSPLSIQPLPTPPSPFRCRHVLEVVVRFQTIDDLLSCQMPCPDKLEPETFH